MAVSTQERLQRLQIGRALLRRAAIAAGTVLAMLTLLYVGFESAQARMPRHRAALEALVRAQTGLNLQFNDLALQWGWAGPEVAFGRIVLEAPGNPDFSLRAAQLNVAFDAWRSIQTGHVQLGSIRLIAPDIDLRAAGAAVIAGSGLRDRSSLRAALSVLRRWSSGRIELEAGTLRLTRSDMEPTSLQIRSAQFARFGRQWSGQMDVVLPARLGRALRMSMDLRGDAPDSPDVAGTVRFDGGGLVLPAWRAVLAAHLPSAGWLPVTGIGSLHGVMNVHAGRVISGEGLLAARDLEFADAAPGALRAAWRLERDRTTWRIALTKLRLGESTPTRAVLSLDELTQRVRGTIDAVDIAQALRALRVDPSGQGGHDKLDALVFESFVPVAGVRTLDLTARWDLTGKRVAPGPMSVQARLSWHAGVAPGASELRAERIVLMRNDIRLQLSGTLAPWHAGAPRPFMLAGRAVHTDPAVLRELFGAEADPWLAPLGGAARGDDIAQAEFELSGDAAHHGALTWRASLANTRLGALEIERLRAVGRQTPGVSVLTPETLQVRARGELAALRGWVARRMPHPPGAELLPEALPASGNATLDFDLHGSRGRGARLVLGLDDARLSLGPQLPPIESLTGSIALEDGRLSRSRLQGFWLGGPLQIRLSSRGTQALAQLDGEMEAAHAAQALGLGVGLLHGRTAWHGEWQWDLAQGLSVPGAPAAGNARRALQWRGSVRSQLYGLASDLSAPFHKQAHDNLALRLDAEGDAQVGTLRIAAGGRLQSVLAIQRARDPDIWRVERGGIALGEASAALPDRPVVAVRGEIAAAELTTLIAGWRELIDVSDAPPLEGALSIAHLTAGGSDYSDALLQAQQTNAGLQLVLDSPDIAGNLILPPRREDRAPGVVHLSRLRLAGVPAGDAALRRLSVLLGGDAQLDIDRLGVGGRELGRLTAVLRHDDDGLAVDRAELVSPLFEAHGALQCVDADRCTADFALETSDVAASLAAFGFRDDVSAGRGRFETSLSWDPRAPRGTLDGHASLMLDDGTVRPASPEHPSFPLLVVPTLLASSESQQIGFRRLEGDFELRDGSAYTSNLHVDGETEILVRGRTGLIARDYDQTAWVLRGADRLPAAIRRIGVAPAVASLWLGLRNLFVADGAQRLLHVGGSWDAPLVTGVNDARAPPLRDAPDLEGVP